MESTSVSNKHKRIVLTMEQKIEILAKLDTGETSVSLACGFNIGKATFWILRKTVMQSWILRKSKLHVAAIHQIKINQFVKNK